MNKVCFNLTAVLQFQLEENLLFGGPQARNNSMQTISIDSIAKTSSQNKTLEA